MKKTAHFTTIELTQDLASMKAGDLYACNGMRAAALIRMGKAKLPGTVTPELEPELEPTEVKSVVNSSKTDSKNKKSKRK